MFYILLALGFLSLALAARNQQPFSAGNAISKIASPIRDLDVLSAAQYTVLAHPAFPEYTVRVKKSKFCDGTVNAFTGYIDVGIRHLFFYFFESRSDPNNDDVIFWTNGGPGASSSLGLFMELGPCRVEHSNGTTFNPYSWNANANIFFVDQPIGVGFSYADYGESLDTTEAAAKDIAAFVSIFFEHFSKFKGKGFHMAGESFGGRYVPVFASEIYDQNPRLVRLGMTPINLTSIMLGNGCTDYALMMSSYYDMQCHPMSVPPIVDIGTCVRMKQMVPRCEKRVKQSCIDTFDTIDCAAAFSFCEENIESPYEKTGYNPYDMTKLCEGKLQETFCYPITKEIGTFLDRPDIREDIGVDPSFTGNFSSVSWPVNTAFTLTMDIARPTQYHVAALLERGIRVLIYVGFNDYSCNWVGNERMTLALEWTRSAEFAAQPLRDWKINGEVAGMTRSAGPLTYATIYGAGHMAPYDMPEVSLELVKL